MAKAKLGVSQREYGRLAGITSAYVSRLVGAGKLPQLPDGSLDPHACDIARAENTRLRSPLAILRASVRICIVCNERYMAHVAVEEGSKNGELFCSAKCSGETLGGRNGQ